MIKRILTSPLILNILFFSGIGSSFVKAEDENEILTLATSRLVIPNKDNVRGNITLPTEVDVDGNTVKISWQSSNPDVITDEYRGEWGKTGRCC